VIEIDGNGYVSAGFAAPSHIVSHDEPVDPSVRPQVHQVLTMLLERSLFSLFLSLFFSTRTNEFFQIQAYLIIDFECWLCRRQGRTRWGLRESQLLLRFLEYLLCFGEFVLELIG
jgi:hypothetical protein